MILKWMTVIALLLPNVVGAHPLKNSTKVGSHATISFEAQDASLTEASKQKLKEIVKEAQAKGKIEDVQLASWSDNPTPRNGEDLSSLDRELAQKRAEAVKGYLNEALEISNVDTFNMAEHASWLAKTLNTKDAQAKANVASKIKNGSKEQYETFKIDGAPSKAVVVVMLKK